MAYATVNPATEEVVQEFEELSDSELEKKLARTDAAFKSWRKVPITERAQPLKKVAKHLRDHSAPYAKLMALEMGKPVAGGEAEVEKCAWACDYYSENASRFLSPEPRDSDGSKAYVRYDPLGPVLAVMPWNFPFWQVLRFAAPAVAAGNAALLKHASNVPQCALAIQESFVESGYPEDLFQNLFISTQQVSAVIADDRVKGVTLTGSIGAGSKVAAQAGKALKPAVMELGGSDPFIVFEDADIAEAAKVGAQARCINTGQSCIAAKRFIVQRNVLDQFLEKFIAGMKGLVIGDPFDKKTQIGPLARVDLRDELAEQVNKSIKLGAKLLCGGEVPQKKGAWYPPTVLGNVKKGMPAYDEEFFGPVASVLTFSNEEEAVEIANDTPFGLGASLWTTDSKRVERLIPQIDAGAVFVNGLVKSDPRLPFGGVKQSGFGRELAVEGIREFVNIKSVWIR